MKNLINKVKFINLPLLLLSAYLIKCLCVKVSLYDVLMLLPIALFYITDKISMMYNEFISVKKMVISENDFRSKVNDDIGMIKSEMSSFKLANTSLNPLMKKR